MSVSGELGKLFPQACGKPAPVDNFVHPHESIGPVRGDGKPPVRGCGKPATGPMGTAGPTGPTGPTGMRKGPSPPRGSGADGPFRGLRAVRAGARRRGQLAAGAGLDEAEEPELDGVEEDADVEDGVEEVDEDPAPTELLEEERLSVR